MAEIVALAIGLPASEVDHVWRAIPRVTVIVWPAASRSAYVNNVRIVVSGSAGGHHRIDSRRVDGNCSNRGLIRRRVAVVHDGGLINDWRDGSCARATENKNILGAHCRQAPNQKRRRQNRFHRPFLKTLPVEQTFKARDVAPLKRQPAAGPAFAGAQNAIGLLQVFSGGDKLIGGDGVEFEHVVVAGNDETRADFPGEICGFVTGQISGNPTFGEIAINREERNIDVKGCEASFHFLEEFCVAGVVDGPRTGLDDVSKKFMATPLIFFDQVVRGGDGSNLEAGDRNGLPGIETARLFSHDTEAVHDEFAISFRNDNFDRRIYPEKWNKSLLVQVIGVIVARGDHVNEVKPLRSYHALGHAHVRFVGGSVFVGQGVGEVRIEQEMAMLPLHEKAALPQPPKMEMVGIVSRLNHVSEKRVILKDGLDH